MQVTMEILRVAGMPNDPVAISGFFIEAERHGVEFGDIGELARMHEPRSIRTKDLCAFELSVLQMREHKARHVSGANRRASCRSSFNELEWLCGFGTHVVSIR